MIARRVLRLRQAIHAPDLDRCPLHHHVAHGHFGGGHVVTRQWRIAQRTLSERQSQGERGNTAGDHESEYMRGFACPEWGGSRWFVVHSPTLARHPAECTTVRVWSSTSFRYARSHQIPDEDSGRVEHFLLTARVQRELFRKVRDGMDSFGPRDF